MKTSWNIDEEKFTQDVLEFINNTGEKTDQDYVQKLAFLFKTYFHDNGGLSAFSLYVKGGKIYNADTAYEKVPGRTADNWNIGIPNSLAEIASRKENKGTVFLVPIVLADQEREKYKDIVGKNRIFILNEETITTRLSITSKEEGEKYSSEHMVLDPDPNGIVMSLITKNNPIDRDGMRPFISSSIVTSIWADQVFKGLLMAGYRSLHCFSGAGYLTPTDTLQVKALTDMIAAGMSSE